MAQQVVTVSFAKGQERNLMHVPGKYERTIRNSKTGREESVVTYVNNMGQLIDMPMEEYNKMRINRGRMTDLGIKDFLFKSRITNLRHDMEPEDLNVAYTGLTFKVDPETGDTRDQAFIDFFANNPESIVDDKPVGNRTPRFVVTNLGNLKNQRVLDRKERQKLLNYLSDIADDTKDGERRLADIMIYFGVVRDNRTADEMVNALIEGEVISKENGNNVNVPAILYAGNNLETFNRVFMNNSDPNKDVILTINKGKAYKKLTVKGAKNAQGWYYKEAFCGIDDRDLLRHFLEHKDIYKSLLAEIEIVEGSVGQSAAQNPIGAAAKTEEITKKNTAIETLNKLVDAGKVILPAGTFIMALELDELNEFIASAKPKKVEHIGDFEPKRDNEAPVAYRTRILKQLGDLVDSDKIVLADGTERGKMKTAAIETYLIAYYTELANSTPI